MDIDQIIENIYHLIIDDLKIIDFPNLKKIVGYHVREGIIGNCSFEEAESQ